MPERRLTKKEQMDIDHPWGRETIDEQIASAAKSISSPSVREKFLDVAAMMEDRRLNPIQFENGRLFPDE